LGDGALIVPLELACQCLFIIGPAKSGTTVLLDALNDSRMVYLLNEPDLHNDPGTPGFAARFNAHYAEWASQLTKGHFCPDFFEGAGSWADNLTRLSRCHHLVGTKIVTRPISSPDQINMIMQFHTINFYESNYIFSFRSPEAVITSSHYFQRSFDTDISPMEDVIYNFAKTVSMFITMRRIFPKVRVVFHHSMNTAIFAELSAELGVDLSRAGTYYEERRIKNHEPLVLSEEQSKILELASEIFDELVALAAEDFPQLQRAQNYFAPDPNTATRLGLLAQRCDYLVRTLARVER